MVEEYDWEWYEHKQPERSRKMEDEVKYCKLTYYRLEKKKKKYLLIS